ncbi:MAG TPA: hypothetical protein VM925_27640 [Labilithrix sp.]|nr:hypothetical protein [Labilithrix sp.]
MKRISMTKCALAVTGLLLLGTACSTVDDGTRGDDDETVGQVGQALSCVPGRACNDGNACTYNDKCNWLGKCIGTAYSCNDGNVCTTDSCNGAGGCNFVPNTNSCNDGNSCTTGDVCSNGVCAGTVPQEQCNNGVDDDCDGHVDGADSDCAPACNPVPEQCSNGVDDDCDGFTDGTDVDCQPQCPDPNDPNDPTCINCQAEFCPSGYVCGSNSRCISHCGDGAWNGDEGDKDCGGACAAKCAAGRHCWTNWDCASGSCYYDVCQ